MAKESKYVRIRKEDDKRLNRLAEALGISKIMALRFAISLYEINLIKRNIIKAEVERQESFEQALVEYSRNYVKGENHE